MTSSKIKIFKTHHDEADFCLISIDDLKNNEFYLKAIPEETRKEMIHKLLTDVVSAKLSAMNISRRCKLSTQRNTTSPPKTELPETSVTSPSTLHQTIPKITQPSE